MFLRSSGPEQAAYGSLRSVVPESELVSTEHGLVPKGQGWFVINARETQWWERKGRGLLCEFEGAGFEGAADFLQLGINLTVLGPGEPMAMYHRETDQEDFLVLSGECVLLIEGEERTLVRWDFIHCPAWTEHTIVGAGEDPCVILAVGSRGADGIRFPVDEAAQKHGASSDHDTTDGSEAYARFQPGRETPYREGWLPE